MAATAPAAAAAGGGGGGAGAASAGDAHAVRRGGAAPVSAAAAAAAASASSPAAAGKPPTASAARSPARSSSRSRSRSRSRSPSPSPSPPEDGAPPSAKRARPTSVVVSADAYDEVELARLKPGTPLRPVPGQRTMDVDGEECVIPRSPPAAGADAAGADGASPSGKAADDSDASSPTAVAPAAPSGSALRRGRAVAPAGCPANGKTSRAAAAPDAVTATAAAVSLDTPGSTPMGGAAAAADTPPASRAPLGARPAGARFGDAPSASAVDPHLARRAAAATSAAGPPSTATLPLETPRHISDAVAALPTPRAAPADSSSGSGSGSSAGSSSAAAYSRGAAAAAAAPDAPLAGKPPAPSSLSASSSSSAPVSSPASRPAAAAAAATAAATTAAAPTSGPASAGGSAPSTASSTGSHHAHAHAHAHAQQAHAPHSAPFAKWEVGADYELVRVLGHGSYGEVAEARAVRTGERVAIKRIHSVFDNEMDTRRIVREMYILRQLRNDNVVRLLDIVAPRDADDFNELYLVFEFVETDLHKLIMSPQYLTIEHVKYLLYQLLCALKYMHSANVIHRDIKPANILLNEDCSLKVCDFGLSRVLRPLDVDASAQPAAPASAAAAAAAAAAAGDAAAGPAAPEEPSPPPQPGQHVDHEATDEPAGAAAHQQQQQQQQQQQRQQAAASAPQHKAAAPTPPGRTQPLLRQLTKHVVTRWYRPPELILLQDYGTPVDVWSVGCIFAELLSMQKESVPLYTNRSALFPGRSCFPLSADHDRTYKDQLDQLNVIFEVIGTPSAEDIGQLGDVQAYLRALPKKEPRDLHGMYPAAPDDAVDLLTRMLAFNPDRRVTVEQALEHPFLASTRMADREISSERSIASLDDATSTRADLKRALLQEVELYRARRRGGGA